MRDSYTIDEFSTGDWSSRPEYSSDDISYNHILLLHSEKDGFDSIFHCGSDKFYAALHLKSPAVFEFYVYKCGSWDHGDKPMYLEPFMWIYGTTFDGVRECSGGQNFTGDLLSMAEVLTWVHNFCCERWPSFNECYDYMRKTR